MYQKDKKFTKINLRILNRDDDFG